MCVAVLAAAGIAVSVYEQPLPPVFYVDEALLDKWNTVLAASSGSGVPPPLSIKTEPYVPGAETAKGQRGFIITTDLRAVAGYGDAGLVPVYRDLNRNGRYRQAFALALDPWLVFRDQDDPYLPRARVYGDDAQGSLLFPGKEAAAVSAWLSQLLQEEPGVFPQDKAVWREAAETLPQNSRFQRGALTYNWNDLWWDFNRKKPAWIYAPLSWVRSLPPDQTTRLVVQLFPFKRDQDAFGLDAQILWAVPFGWGDKQEKKLKVVTDWLASAGTQTLFADALGWIPAHRGGKPFNLVCYNAHLAWLRSSYVWQNPSLE